MKTRKARQRERAKVARRERSYVADMEAKHGPAPGHLSRKQKVAAFRVVERLSASPEPEPFAWPRPRIRGASVTFDAVDEIRVVHAGTTLDTLVAVSRQVAQALEDFRANAAQARKDGGR